MSSNVLEKESALVLADNQPEPFDVPSFLARLHAGPGVYQILGGDGRLLYVGKARNLKRRVSSYFQKQRHSPKTQAMLAQLARVEVIHTHTETEALVLEAQLIKKHHPPYNILLRDDKSYPYLFIDTRTPFPAMRFHRGAQRAKGYYFGPYPASSALRESMVLLQKAFRLRTCEDSVFAHRSRACLHYQIQRCSGPCVGHIDADRYAADVEATRRFLEGRSDEVVQELEERMQQAAERLDFEEAARLRDQLAALAKVQERQYVAQAGGGDFDVLAAVEEGGRWCIYASFLRHGRQLGGRALFPQHIQGVRGAELMAAFLAQFYTEREIPGHVLVNLLPRSATVLAASLTQLAGHRVSLESPQRGARRRWMELAENNARLALRARNPSREEGEARMLRLQQLFGLSAIPRRIECFDISHTRGESATASCVVFDAQGPCKDLYRRFHLRDITPGDDYAAMEQVVARRYGRLQREGQKLPEIVFIDGGPGQLARAEKALADLGIHGIQLCGIAKGSSRRPGLEWLHAPQWPNPQQLADDDPTLHWIQEIRDEAHRFAITGHRARRQKSRQESELDLIEGVGPKRRLALLRRFGGLRGVRDAGIDDLQRVEGIHEELARRIYDHFHSGPQG
ncbi:MAG: excinuclease ABC subunit UvrC [Acidithiobacillus sp.]|nr:excinuclease ABC subunit UvrC [Acidithiobacillus sp.]